MDTSTKKQVECGVYCENFVMIGLTADAGDNFKKRASIPLAPCMCSPTQPNIPLPPHRGREKEGVLTEENASEHILE
jgi:hypothetical protein